MLSVAFVKNKPGTVLGNVGRLAKSRKWWNEGDRPAGLHPVGFYGFLGAHTPAVYVFEAGTHEDMRKMIDYWKEMEFDIHPAVNFAKILQQQGMKVV